jgi:SPX domain protein involved in polyphosphate accumulation
MLPVVEQSDSLRYERKFLITDYSHLEVMQMLKLHPACFSEIFYERTINNIYFDTLGMNHYYDNVEGSSDRLKVRIRWYGQLFGDITKPVLEYKIKKGLLGKKDSYALQPFSLNINFDETQIIKSLDTDKIPLYVKDELLSLKPALLNCYTRKYFLSADKKFRITIDYNLNYYKIAYTGNTFLSKSVDHASTVLELKYDSTDEVEGKDVGAMLPFALTKNSKYLQGLERVFM